MTAPIHIMLQTGIMLQTSNSLNVNGAINQVVNQIGVPIFDAMLAVGGISFIITLLYFLVHFARYMLHPTSWGRSSALSEAVYHIERLIFVPLGLFLGIYLFLFIAGLVSGQNMTQYAGQILQAMFMQVVNIFKTLINSALSTTP